MLGKFEIKMYPKSYLHIAQVVKLFKVDVVDFMTSNAFGSINNIKEIRTSGNEWDFFTKDGSNYAHFNDGKFYEEGYFNTDDITFRVDETHHMTYVTNKNELENIVNYLVENNAIELI